MNRRDFGGMFMVILGGLIAGGSAISSGKKVATSSGASSAGAAAANAATDAAATAVNNNFYVTITTFFPREMDIVEYKSLVNQCRNVDASNILLEAMRAEGKLLNTTSKFSNTNVVTGFEFLNEKAFHEYEARYHKIEGNSTDKKKALGFKSKREFKQHILA